MNLFLPKQVLQNHLTKKSYFTPRTATADGFDLDIHNVKKNKFFVCCP